MSEDLHLSAAKVDVHADELQARHVAANGRIEAAQVGVPSTAAVALSAALTKWQADTAVLVGNVLDHGEALRGAATTFLATEQHNAARLQCVGNEASSFDLGL